MPTTDPDRTAAEREKQLDTLDRLAQQFGRSLSNAFDRNLNAGRQLDGLLGTLATKLSNIAVRAAVSPVRSLLENLFKGLLGSLTGSGEATALARGGVIAQGRLMAFRQGAVLAAGRVRPFAGGGIVAAPTYFPMAGGASGLMGEAGPEAILPLRRGSDGRLGVAASRGPGAERPMAVTVNIATPDIESFRRSEAQVAASLSRAIARGRRAL